MGTEQRNQKTILLLEEDDETRGPLMQSLRQQGYRIIIAINEEDAIERVRDAHVHPDLVLVNLVGKSADEVLDVGRRIREHAKYDGHTPLIVMPEKYGKDVEGTVVNVEGNDWIFYLGEEPGQLENFLASLELRLPE